MMGRVLLLLRHGESSANANDAFGGWLDFSLTARGRGQAISAGKMIAEARLAPAVVHTSLLTRAIDTATIAVSQLGGRAPTTRRTWRLNERHYGTLQGRARSTVRKEVGSELFAQWRRSLDVAPPPVSTDDPMHPGHDPRYAAVPPDQLPASESLVSLRERIRPCWDAELSRDCFRFPVVLVVAHGNSIRMLRMLLDGLSDAEVLELDVPTGVPLRYDLDDTLTPIVRGGVYLGPHAKEGPDEVAAGGSTRPCRHSPA